ncbi:motility associated factor glycosyltransferase family protein [Clostridium beijerinckii]|uniref:motility associated factor glycosyltransferase family protein n=1 Tax=Clostridium beijerinckii TaxID=1520 RepID=UPI00156EA695|nr:6-hydroxymethylpterin diphosphokinase MptE-like protein [Clostridium beijerinckii]NRT73717.1 hypothetical protein [Clostridium beijerinckii]
MSLNIEISKDGYKILRLNKNDKVVYLGSKYSQEREIKKFIDQFGEFTQKDNFIILGLSFGEHIKELLKNVDEKSRILVIEFNNELIEYCRNDDEIKKIIDNDRVTLTSEIKEIELFIYKYISEANVERLRVKSYSIYDKIYGEELQKIYIRIKALLVRFTLERNTIESSGRIFFESILSNLKYIAKSTEVNKLRNAYENKPAIIVSAGPSLIKNIDQLKGINDALILSGGRTLGALLERNINPTCLGVVDAGEVSYKLVEPYIKNIRCPLLFSETTNNKVVSECESVKFFDTQSNFIRKAWSENIISLCGGGSIAHTLTNFAIYLGCSPIIFIGQDLAYTGEQGHASCSGNRWDEWSFDKYKNENDIYVKDINGNLVRTSVVLNDYRICLEEIINAHPNTKFINATEGGANIEGAENRILGDILKELKSDEIVSMENFSINEDRTEDIIKELQNNLRTFEVYIQLCEKGKRLLKEYKKYYYLKDRNKTNEIIQKLDEIENNIKKNSGEINLTTTIIAQALYTINNMEEFIIKSSDSKLVAFNKDVNRSEALYSGIEDVMKECYEMVEKTIKELKGEC